MGEQQIQSGSGIRSETVPDQAIDSTQHISTDSEQNTGVRLQWKRPNPNGAFIKQLEMLVKTAGYAIRKDVEKTAKLIKSMEKSQ